MVAITSNQRDVILDAVQAMYTAVASTPDQEFHFPTGRRACELVGYPAAQLDRLPPVVVETMPSAACRAQPQLWAECIVGHERGGVRCAVRGRRIPAHRDPASPGLLRRQSQRGDAQSGAVVRRSRDRAAGRQARAAPGVKAGEPRVLAPRYPGRVQQGSFSDMRRQRYGRHLATALGFCIATATPASGLAHALAHHRDTHETHHHSRSLHVQEGPAKLATPDGASSHQHARVDQAVRTNCSSLLLAPALAGSAPSFDGVASDRVATVPPASHSAPDPPGDDPPRLRSPPLH